MAMKKFDWVAIKNDYYLDKYKDLKGLAQAYGVNYDYMRKKAATWKKDKSFIAEIQAEINGEVDFIDEQERQAIMQELNSIPDDRTQWHKRLWDKLGLAAERALDNPEMNFYTHEGILKAKALADVANVIEKVQKGQSEAKDDKVTGQLENYANLIASYRVKAEQQEVQAVEEEYEEDED